MKFLKRAWLAFRQPANESSNLMYRIITHQSLAGLEREVRESIAEGWTPLGGNSISTLKHHKYEGTEIQWVQAMVKGGGQRLGSHKQRR